MPKGDADKRQRGEGKKAKGVRLGVTWAEVLVRTHVIGPRSSGCEGAGGRQVIALEPREPGEDGMSILNDY